jgi:hypothetical protein
VPSVKKRELKERYQIPSYCKSAMKSTQCTYIMSNTGWLAGWSSFCSFPTIYIVTYSGCSIHAGTLLHSKSQYTTVKHSQKLLEHTYTSDPHGLGTLTPVEFFQQDLLWRSSNIHSHSCSQKASKHTSGQSIVGLSVHFHTTTAPRRIVHH